MAFVTLNTGDEISLGAGTHTIDGTGKVTFTSTSAQATYAGAGGAADTVAVVGASTDYNASKDGTNLVLTHKTTGKTITIASGTTADTVTFSNGSLTLQYVTGTGIKLGTQVVSNVTPAAISDTPTGAGTSTGTGSTAGQSFSLTTTAESKILTAGNDTVDGSTASSLNAGDVITDGSTTDTDTLNATINAGVAATIVNVETINATGQFLATGFDFASTTGNKVLNVATGLANGAATITNAKATAGAAIVAASSIKTFDVTSAATGTGATAVKVTAGSGTTDVTVTGVDNYADNYDITLAAAATALTLNAGTGTDAYTVKLAGNTLTLTGNNANETITLNSTGAANTVTAATAVAATKTVVTGDKDLTLKSTVGLVAGKTVELSSYTGKLTLQITDGIGADSDLSKIAANTVDITVANADANTITVNEISTVKLSANSQDKLTVKKADGVTVVDTLTVSLAADQTALVTTAVDNLLLSATKAVTVTTLNTVANGTLADNAETVVLSGSKDITISTLTSKANSVVTADSTFTGKLNIGGTAITNDVTVIGGSGADTIKNAKVAQGGAGDDVIIAKAATASTLSGDAGNDSITGAGVNDTINGGAGSDTIIGADGIDSLTGGDGADTFSLAGIKLVANRDVITDFTAGTDKFGVAGADTTVATTFGNLPFQEFATALVAGASAWTPTGGTLTTTTAGVIEITTALSANGTLANDTTDGTELLKALSSTSTAATGITTATEADKFYIVAYQGGKGYVYYAAEGVGTKLAVAADIQLVGVLNNVADGALSAGDFIITG